MDLVSVDQLFERFEIRTPVKTILNFNSPLELVIRSVNEMKGIVSNGPSNIYRERAVKAFRNDIAQDKITPLI